MNEQEFQKNLETLTVDEFFKQMLSDEDLTSDQSIALMKRFAEVATGCVERLEKERS